MPPRTPPVSLGQSRPADTAGARAAGPGEVAFAWSSIRGGTTGWALPWQIAPTGWAGRQVRYVATVATRTKQKKLVAACLLAAGRRRVDDPYPSMVQCAADRRRRAEQARGGLVRAGLGDRREKADGNQLSLSTIGVACA